MNKNNIAAASPVWQLVIFSIVQVLIFSALFHTVYRIEFSGTGLFFDFASKVVHGNVPYRDFPLEYPPFALFFFILPRFCASNWVSYAIFYQAEVIIFALIGLFVVYDIARRLGQSAWKLMTVYTLAVLAMGPIVGQQYDIFPGVMVLLAVYFFWLGKGEISFVLLALGTLTKIFPAVVVPILLVCYLRSRQYRRFWSGIAVFGLVVLLILLPFLLIAPSSLLSLYDYHAERGIQLESTYSSLLMLADKLHLVTIRSDFGFGAWNIVGSIEKALATLSTFLLVALSLGNYWFAFRRMRPGKPDVKQIGALSLLAVLIVLITSKILSPQYIIWVIPLLPLVGGRWREAVWLMFIVVGGLTYLIFPHQYTELIDLETGPVIVLLFRNLLLILMAVFLAITIWEQRRITKDQKLTANKLIS